MIPLPGLLPPSSPTPHLHPPIPLIGGPSSSDRRGLTLASSTASRPGKVTASGLETWQRGTKRKASESSGGEENRKGGLGMGMQGTPARRKKIIHSTTKSIGLQSTPKASVMSLRHSTSVSASLDLSSLDLDDSDLDSSALESRDVTFPGGLVIPSGDNITQSDVFGATIYVDHNRSDQHQATDATDNSLPSSSGPAPLLLQEEFVVPVNFASSENYSNEYEDELTPSATRFGRQDHAQAESKTFATSFSQAHGDSTSRQTVTHEDLLIPLNDGSLSRSTRPLTESVATHSKPGSKFTSSQGRYKVQGRETTPYRPRPLEASTWDNNPDVHQTVYRSTPRPASFIRYPITNGVGSSLHADNPSDDGVPGDVVEDDLVALWLGQPGPRFSQLLGSDDDRPNSLVHQLSEHRQASPGSSGLELNSAARPGTSKAANTSASHRHSAKARSLDWPWTREDTRCAHSIESQFDIRVDENMPVSPVETARWAGSNEDRAAQVDDAFDMDIDVQGADEVGLPVLDPSEMNLHSAGELSDSPGQALLTPFTSRSTLRPQPVPFISGKALPERFVPSSQIDTPISQASFGRSTLSFSPTPSIDTDARTAVTPPPLGARRSLRGQARIEPAEVKRGLWRGRSVLARMNGELSLIAEESEEGDDLSEPALEAGAEKMTISATILTDEEAAARFARIQHYKDVEDSFDLHVELVLF